MDIHEVIKLIAFLTAIILPLFLVLRWRGFGFLLAVILGWGIIHASNLLTPVREQVDAVFAGIWMALGWAYMLVWCLLVAGCQALLRIVVSAIRQRSGPDSLSDPQPILDPGR